VGTRIRQTGPKARVFDPTLTCTGRLLEEVELGGVVEVEEGDEDGFERLSGWVRTGGLSSI
jgi:hypothetical protein